MKLKFAMPFAICCAAATLSCQKHATADPDINYNVDRFADIEVIRYTVPGFDSLSLDQKKLIYYLNEAALTGRDIIWDQNCKFNLPIRHMLEGIYTSYDGDKNSDDYKAFETYLKQVEFANGIHHHYSMDKFTPGFSRQW
ncbi:MAG: dihydrofolate reductase, partial [Muribaculaceae bacterium]|nr:dihydrofolate reductase [Muribaculaceae bacterium]